MLELINDEPLPSYALGDVPSIPLAFTLDSDTTWTAVSADVGVADLTEGSVTLTLPELEDAGLITIRLTFTDGAAHQEAAEPVRIVVEDPASQWLTLAQLRAEWADAPDDNAQLWELLESAREACLAFAPALPEDAPVPASWRKAQRLQVQAIWNASRATNTNEVGEGEHAVAVFPLDWNVKQLLRPQSALPGMF